MLESVDKGTELAIVRRAYAMNLLAAAGVSDPRIMAAYAEVPREHYLGPGPWPALTDLRSYVPTPSDNPVYLYTDRLFGLIPERRINNGQPSLHVRLLASANIASGEHVVHLGVGTGYYTAILAHMVGPSGRVTAIELDAGLAERARANLSGIMNVRVVSGDAFNTPFEPADVIYLNASVARISVDWIDGLRDGGRLILPMSTRSGLFARAAGAVDLAWLTALAAQHVLFRIERRGEVLHVRQDVMAAFVAAEGPEDAAAERALAAALEKGGAKNVTRLYRNEEVPEERCWLRGEGWCLAYA